MQVPTAQDLTDVSFPDANTGFAIDTSDALRFTGNGGAQWTPIDTGDTPSVNAILALDRNTAILFTDRGIFRSTAAADTSGGGTTFESIDNAKVRRTAFTDFDRTDGQVLFAWGPTSLWTSTNRGATWRTVRRPGQAAALPARRLRVLAPGLRADDRRPRVDDPQRRRAGGRELPATGTQRGHRHGVRRRAPRLPDDPELGRRHRVGGWVLATSDGGAHLAAAAARAGRICWPAASRHPARPARSRWASARAAAPTCSAPTPAATWATSSAITVKPSTRRLRRAGSVRLTVQLARRSPACRWRCSRARAGAPAGRWSTRALTTAGKLDGRHAGPRDHAFVAQWAGDADRNGDGSPVTTVTLRR